MTQNKIYYSGINQDTANDKLGNFTFCYWPFYLGKCLNVIRLLSLFQYILKQSNKLNPEHFPVIFTYKQFIWH